jgi:16S rRNA (guanine1207-N2)-methyltransferase
MEHYYTSNPSSKSDKKKIDVIVLGNKYSFYTDSGVFSRSGLDFGSRLLIETIEGIHGSVLDIGCGYGPIGIILSNTYDIDVTMADVNERALELTAENCEMNGVEANIIQSDIYSNIEETYDYIVTNPPIRIGKKGLTMFLAEAKKYLKENGELWFVMRKQQGALSMIELLKKDYNVEIVKKRKGFCIIRAFSVDL